MKVWLSKLNRLSLTNRLSLISMLFILPPSAFILAFQTFPAPPADRALIYLAGTGGTLEALPFEAGATPLKAEAVAASDKRSYVELKGAQAAKAITDTLPRIYLFITDEAGAHPPFLVRLTEKGKARRVTAMAQKGLKGYAIDSEEIVKPHYRVLLREGGMVYMEITPRESLLPGEYAIIGTDLQRIATFRVASAPAR